MKRCIAWSLGGSPTQNFCVTLFLYVKLHHVLAHPHVHQPGSTRKLWCPEFSLEFNDIIMTSWIVGQPGGWDQSPAIPFPLPWRVGSLADGGSKPQPSNHVVGASGLTTPFWWILCIHPESPQYINLYVVQGLITNNTPIIQEFLRV